MEMMSRLTRDGTAGPVSRGQILRRERGQGINRFPCSVDHEQDWPPYPVDPYSYYIYVMTYMPCSFLFGVFHDFPWKEAAQLICLVALRFS